MMVIVAADADASCWLLDAGCLMFMLYVIYFVVYCLFSFFITTFRCTVPCLLLFTSLPVNTCLMFKL